MTCRDFQFEEGKTYTHDGEPELCKEGFHACEVPLDCLQYYKPSDGSIYHEVEMDGVTDEREDDSKRVGKTIKIGARISIRDIVNISIDYFKRKTKDSLPATSGDESTAATSGDVSTAATSGYGSTAATSGDESTAATSGYVSTAATSGYGSTAATSGDSSTAATSGDESTAATSGDRSTAATSGYGSTAATSGDRSTAATSGYGSTAATSGDGSTAIVEGKESVAVVTGRGSKAKGALGCWLVLTERGEWNGETYPIVEVRAVKVDGVAILPDTFYALKGGEIVACD